MKFLFHKQSSRNQFIISLAVIGSVVLLGLLLHELLGYRMVAFMLLAAVSILAMVLDIVPVLTAALLSAVLWNFLFIPPRFTLTIGTTEDRILLTMYFVIALINGVLTYKIRQIEKVVKEKDEKAKSVKFYNTLLNSLSHELRTPITTIVGSTDNLLMNSNNLSETDKAELLSEIYIATDRLNQQIENLLSMSRLESGFFQPKRDWCDIDELIHKTLNRLEASLRKYRVTVRIPEPFPLFRLDFGLMEQVMYNLLLNVTQHTPPGTSITIEAMSQMDEVEISIADNGKGFPKEELGKVFEKFHRVNGSKTGGTGLGLSIVKGFVEAHGGTVRVQNLQESGSRFTIKIPADRSTINKLNDE